MVSTTREAVISVMREFDAVGMEKFLTVYGYGWSVSYVIRYEGREYPSKAILGVSAGLSSGEFSGGSAHTVRVLRGLGFTVVRKVGMGMKRLAMVAAMVATMLPFQAKVFPSFPVDVISCYSSGLDGGYIVGAAMTREWDVGVTAKKMSAFDERCLGSVVGVTRVFLDSGAFGEFQNNQKRAKAGKASVYINDEGWRKILHKGARVAWRYGSDVSVVVPDRVRDQMVTLELQDRYRSQIQAIRSLGAVMLVPVQRGVMSQIDFWYEECSVLGFVGVPAFPCAAAATPPADVHRFVEVVKPPLIHLLGVGPFNKKLGEFLGGLVGTGCRVQMDACQMGNANARHVGPKALDGKRRLTYASDVAAGYTSSVYEKKVVSMAACFGVDEFVGVEG